MTKNSFPKFFFLQAFFLTLFLATGFPGVDAQTNSNPEKWRATTIEGGLKELDETNPSVQGLLIEDTIHAGLLFRSHEENAEPHSNVFDALYMIDKGELILEIAGKVTSILPGDVGYVRAGVTHTLKTSQDSLVILQISPTSPSSGEDPGFQVFKARDIRAQAKPDSNEWNPFLDINSMRFGLYMLPLALDGDETLTHEIDEINIVIKGKSKFRMDEDEIDVGPGSVMWVKAGVGHYFYDLSEDFEVLILFRKDSE